MNLGNPYVLPLALAALMSALLAALAWRHRAARGAAALTGVMLGAAQWALASALQWASATPAGQYFWFNARFAGTEVLSVFFLVFALSYVGQIQVRRAHILALLALPALSLLVLWTNAWHHLFLAQVSHVPFNGGTALEVHYGPWFWIHTAYDYALLGAALLLFARAFYRAPGLYKGQILSIVISAAAPLAANVLTISGLSPFPHLDLTPFGFSLTALALAAGFVGFGMLDIVPAARDAVIQSLDDALLILDPRQRVVDLNPAAERLLGRPAAEVVGQAVAAVLPGWADLTATGVPATPVLLNLPGGDGSCGEFEARRMPITDRAGRLTGQAVLLRDLTRQREVESTLRLTEARFLAAMDTIADAYYETDLKGTLTFVNTAFARAVDYTPAEIVGKNFRRFTDRDSARSMLQAYHEVYTTGQPVNRANYRFQRRDGSDLFAELSINLRHDAAGQPVGFRGLIRDVTDRKRAEEALRQSEEKYRTILDNIEDGYYELDLHGRFTVVTDVTAKVAGLPREAALGRSFGDFTDRKDAARLFRIYNTVYRTGQPVRDLGYRITLPDGTHRFLEASASLIRDADGNPVGFRGMIRDMTDRRRAEEELRQAKEAAEAASQAKTVFLTTVSHELRTPLTSVLGFAKLIRKRLQDVILPALQTGDRKVQRAWQQVTANLDIIVSEGERLTALINNLLDLAKIEAGKVEWNLQPVAVGEVIERAVAATTALAEQKRLQLVTEIAPVLPIVQADRDRLIQVVINLISNAVKFTAAGSVTCRARPEAGGVEVHVMDTGVGIALADQARVFDQFVQVGDTLTDKPTGTGLGLPICKQIVEHHGGRIWVESETGQGSTFAFWLPALAAVPQPEPEAGQPAAEAPALDMGALIQQLRERVGTAANGLPAERRHVLIVDDDRNIRTLLRQELEADGYAVQEAEDGRAALASVKQAPPALIILDVMMPELSGFDVAAVLRSDPATRRIPIIILSVIRDRERGFRVGVDRYFTKPVDAEALLAEVGQLLAAGQSHKRVLVVDSDTAVVQTLSEVLQAQGYHVAAAYDGREGLQKALATRPDLVIVNSMLPEQAQLVQSLRFEKGMENVAFFLFH